jgi:Family of unknown function (DUF6069)
MSLAQRASRLTGTRPAVRTVPPTHRRVVAAGLAAAAVSLAADLILATIGQAAFTVPAAFGKFSFATYALLTVLGVAGAATTWAAVTRLSSRPKWLLTRLAALVTALFLIPDFLLLGTWGNPAGPVAILMLMHLAIAVITYTALTELAPVRGGPRWTRPADAGPANAGPANAGPANAGPAGAGLVEVVEEKLDARGGVAPEDLLHQVRIPATERRQQVAVILDPAQTHLRVLKQGFHRTRPPLLADDGQAEDHAP